MAVSTRPATGRISARDTSPAGISRDRWTSSSEDIFPAILILEINISFQLIRMICLKSKELLAILGLNLTRQ